MRGFARTFADQARASGRTVVAYQYSPLGGPLDPESSERFIPRRSFSAGHSERHGSVETSSDPARLLGARGNGRDRRRRAPVVPEAPRPRRCRLFGFSHGAGGVGRRRRAGRGRAPARSEEQAVAVLRRFGTAVAVKAEVPGLLHKSDLGCVRLACASERDVQEAYRAVVENARKAGFRTGASV